jgi:YidC/Oxa1 family membrane protein insertase
MQLVGNWGWAIIILTLLIKLAFYKLSETSYRSMANMRKLAPRLKSLKERYGDDKQRLNQAMMEMYKKEKINPLGGCLPILVQIPVFIALYWVLLESVELRQADFICGSRICRPGSVFRAAADHGRDHVHPAEAQPAPPGPDPGQGDDDPAVVFTVFFAFFPARGWCCTGWSTTPCPSPSSGSSPGASRPAPSHDPFCGRP